jgi:hypothetical protein
MNLQCPRCGSAFACSNCEYPLWKVKSGAHETNLISAAVQPISEELQSYLRTVGARSPYVPNFPVGPRGGALIDFGELITLECFLPYEDENTGEILPFLPMPLTGDRVHDVQRSDPELCLKGECACERPVGWQLTRPIIRALLGATDSFVNEHSAELPGRLPGWRVRVDTLTFMRDCYFNPEFTFPMRAAGREARHERHAERRAHRRPPPPHSRPLRDGRSGRK